MADTKISALTALTGVNVDTAADVLPIVDTDAATTKKILIDELRTALGIATQANMETATSLVTTVTPGRQHFHPGHPKAWGDISMSGGTPTLDTSYNITSITDTAVGRVTITIATDFSGANYAVAISQVFDGTNVPVPFVVSKAAGSFEITVRLTGTGAASDLYAGVDFICCGDQA